MTSPGHVSGLCSSLPSDLPGEPMGLFGEWFEEAHRRALQPNPNVFYLATANADGTPSVRAVLCKGKDLQRGYIVFYTNYEGTKSRDLVANPRAAAVFHWDHLGVQARISGPVVRSPDAESDAYFASRSVQARLGAWASEQSRPMGDRDELALRLAEMMERFGVTLEDLEADADTGVSIPRPAHWGGWRIWARRVELWVSGDGRLHDRAAWERDVELHDDGSATTGTWTCGRLFP